MNRSYLWLFVAVIALALVLTALGRPRAHAPERLPTAPLPPRIELAIGVSDRLVSPAITAVPRGSQVRLRVDYRGTRPGHLALSGYEDRLRIPELSPGTVWRGEFLADRPGEDFAWLLDGEPAGRLSVTGSHLVEGHR